jgi:hypothetical protein
MVKNIFSNRLQNALYVDKVMILLGMENTTPNGWTSVETSSDSLAANAIAVKQAEKMMFEKYGIRQASAILSDGSVARGIVHGTQQGQRMVRMQVAFKEYRDGTTDDTFTGVIFVDAGVIRYGTWPARTK